MKKILRNHGIAALVIGALLVISYLYRQSSWRYRQCRSGHCRLEYYPRPGRRVHSESVSAADRYHPLFFTGQSQNRFILCIAVSICCCPSVCDL